MDPLEIARDLDGCVRIAAVHLLHRLQNLWRQRKPLSPRTNGWDPGKKSREEHDSDRASDAGAHHFTIFSQPSSQAAVTYIVKHSSAKGRKPRKPGAGISKIFACWNI